MLLTMLTVCEPISKAMASGLGARHQPLQGHAADQRDHVQCVWLEQLVLQLSGMLDRKGDEMTCLYTQQREKGRLDSRNMASEKGVQSRAGADAASAERSMEVGYEVRERPSVRSVTGARLAAT